MKSIQPYIPNVLTILRMILTFLIMIFGFFKQTYTIIIFFIIVVTIAFVHKYFIKQQGISSPLHLLADKLFAIGMTGGFIPYFSILWIPFILEIILGSIHLLYHFKRKKMTKLITTKMKIPFLFATIIATILTIFYTPFIHILFGMVYATVNLQALSIFQYGYHFLSSKKDISIENNIMHQKIMKEEDNEELAQTLILEDLQKIAQEYQYNNETDDIL